MKSRNGQFVQLRLRTKHRSEASRRLQLEVHSRGDAVSNFLREYGIWQRPITVFSSQFLQRGEVAIDVGAHIGYFATVFADAVGPEGAVFAFEPDPDNYQILDRNRSINGFNQIKCKELAVSDQAAELKLHKSTTNLWGSSLVKKPMHRSEVSVPSAPLDQLMDQEKRPIGLIKIDVEGAELSVLKGMMGLLRRQSVPPAVIMEFSSSQIEAADPGLHFILDFIYQFGFEVRPFISHEGPKVLPPRIEAETLVKIHRDFLGFGEAAELDLLLLVPEALRRWQK